MLQMFQNFSKPKDLNVTWYNLFSTLQPFDYALKYSVFFSWYQTDTKKKILNISRHNRKVAMLQKYWNIKFLV